MSAILKDPVWKHTRRKMFFVDRDSMVTKAAKIMKEESVGSVIVLDGAKAVGILTQRDLISKIVADGKNPNVVKVSDVMSSPLITIKKDETVEKAMSLIEKYNIRRIVVLDDEGKPYGISVELRVCGDLLNNTKSWLDQRIGVIAPEDEQCPLEDDI
jgi:CBS domain-containing protein